MRPFGAHVAPLSGLCTHWVSNAEYETVTKCVFVRADAEVHSSGLDHVAMKFAPQFTSFRLAVCVLSA